jgi:uncharacterized membrane protein
MAPLPSAPLAANPTMAASLPPVTPEGLSAKPATSDPAPITIQANGQPAPVDFDKQVQPFFANYCLQCHGPNRQSGRTRFDTKAGILARVTPGDSAGSILYRYISATSGTHMPPVGQDQPTADEVAMIKQWITEGAKISASYPVNAPGMPGSLPGGDADHPVNAPAPAPVAPAPAQ